MHLHCIDASLFLLGVIATFVAGFFGHRWLSREERRDLHAQLAVADVLLHDIHAGASPLTFRGAGVWRRLCDYLAKYAE